MATWTQNEPTGVSKRRRWNLEDRASLNKLKNHIAQEGCPQMQYDLAKQILDNTIEPNMDKIEQYQKAVNWLVTAAHSGHEDSAKLLKNCYNDGRGITAENADDVRRCLSMTPGERAARKAARELFACLSNGNEHVTPKQLERKMRCIYNLQRKRRRLEDETSGSSSEGEPECELLGNMETIGHANEEHQRLITEANLVSAASNYSAGRMPTVNDTLTLSVPDPRSLDHVPRFYRIFFHPLIFFTLFYHRLVNCIISLPSILPVSVRLGLLIALSWWRSFQLVPLISYYFSVGMMIWATCKMLKTKQQFVDFRIWSGLFLRYGDNNIDAGIAEKRFLRNNMKPYVYYFGAFICNLIVYPLVADGWMPHSELTIISGAFTLLTMGVSMYASSDLLPNWVVVVSFAVNVLAKYPYEMDKVVTSRWRFLDLRKPTFSTFVIGNGIEFCLNCRTALYLLIPVLLVIMAKRSRWHGVYTHLIPHCVTLCWLQVCIATSQSATMFGVIRGTLVLAGLVLFLPLFGMVALLVPVFVAIKSLGLASEQLHWGGVAIASILIMVVSYLLAMNRATQKYITILQLIMGLTMACVLVFPYMTSSFKDTPRFNALPRVGLHSLSDADSLTWDRFHSLCALPFQEEPNRIKSQLRCFHLNGMPVTWQGSVTKVEIAKVSNMFEDLVANYLPGWLGRAVRCAHGEDISQNFQCNRKLDDQCDEWQRVIKTVNARTGSCTLQKYNRYEYELLVKVGSSSGSRLLGRTTSSEVVLKAHHDFGNFTRQLSQGDTVLFYGTLHHTRMRTNDVQVLLKTIECRDCKSPELGTASIERLLGASPMDARLQELMRGIKYLLNALLNPLITFK
ncbi:wolframin [Drosophila obscura]|uniref:wolframin n=1 Tax=Drosophila obscura TaxID=7282 RepID=UPI001BB0E679|nr:wolframin [Drosophila obscura]